MYYNLNIKLYFLFSNEEAEPDPEQEPGACADPKWIGSGTQNPTKIILNNTTYLILIVLYGTRIF